MRWLGALRLVTSCTYMRYKHIRITSSWATPLRISGINFGQDFTPKTKGFRELNLQSCCDKKSLNFKSGPTSSALQGGQFTCLWRTGLSPRSIVDSSALPARGGWIVSPGAVHKPICYENRT